MEFEIDKEGVNFYHMLARISKIVTSFLEKCYEGQGENFHFRRIWVKLGENLSFKNFMAERRGKFVIFEISSVR